MTTNSPDSRSDAFFRAKRCKLFALQLCAPRLRFVALRFTHRIQKKKFFQSNVQGKFGKRIGTKNVKRIIERIKKYFFLSTQISSCLHVIKPTQCEITKMILRANQRKEKLKMTRMKLLYITIRLIQSPQYDLRKPFDVVTTLTKVFEWRRGSIEKERV